MANELLRLSDSFFSAQVKHVQNHPPGGPPSMESVLIFQHLYCGDFEPVQLPLLNLQKRNWTIFCWIMISTFNRLDCWAISHQVGGLLLIEIETQQASRSYPTQTRLLGCSSFGACHAVCLTRDPCSLPGFPEMRSE